MESAKYYNNEAELQCQCDLNYLCGTNAATMFYEHMKLKAHACVPNPEPQMMPIFGLCFELFRR